MKKKQNIEQNINVASSQNVTIIQACGNVYYDREEPDKAKGLLPEAIESELKDGDKRDFCFISIDVAGHSGLSSKFNPEVINNTLMNLRNRLNSIITKNNGKELNWAGDGGIFYFLEKKVNDKTSDNAILSSIEILNGLANFNNSSNELCFEGKRTDIRLRLGIDFGSAIYHKDPGNWHSEALNTSAKVQAIGFPNSVLITDNVYKNLTDKIRLKLKEEFHLRESSVKFSNHILYIFSREKIIDPIYENYFLKISKLRQEEFSHLDYWVDLYGIETKLVSKQEQDKRRVVRAVELVNECVESGKNAIIFGNSGAGKTFICLKLFEIYKDKYLSCNSDLNERIPLFIEVARIKNNLNEFIPDEKDMDKYIMFLDGLNEAGDLKKQEEMFGEITRFCLLNSKTRVFVTTQIPIESKEFEFYEIQPFDRDDVAAYLSKFKDKFDSKKEAESFYDSFTSLVKDFISIPEFLSILVSTYKKQNMIEINNPGELFKEYEEFLCGSRENTRPRLDEKYQKHFIPFLAFNMCKENEKRIEWTKFNEYAGEYNRITHSSIDVDEIKNIITRQYKLIKKDEEDNYEFIHQTLRDYFAAVYMKNNRFESSKIFELVYINNTQNNNIVNAVRLLVGIIEPEIAKNIVNEFIDKNLYLACELFAWSAILDYEKKLTEEINNKIDIYSREYLLNLNEIILFYLKILDLCPVSHYFN